MKDRPAPPSSDLDRAPAFAWFSLLAGALSILLLVSIFQPPPQSAAEQLSFFADHRGAAMLLAVGVLTWAVFSQIRDS